MGGAFDRSASPLEVREDLVFAHRSAWVHLATPGSWWSGAERVAIAAETRNALRCPLCEERERAPAPSAVSGSHRSLGRLPDAAVEAIHRIALDPGRLSKAWLGGLRSAGLGDGAYVEIVGAVSTLISIDAFHWGLGLPLEPLPEPRSGEASGYRPEGAGDHGAWVPMLPQRPGAAESDLWRGRTGNVIRALSLVPEEVRNLKRLSRAQYLDVADLLDPRARNALSRPQMELIAGRVSAMNECFY